MASEDLDGLLAQADQFRINGEYEKAQPLYEKILSQDDSIAAAWNGLGHCQLNTGFFEESIASYEKAWQLAPDELKYGNHLGKALCMIGEYERAKQVFKEVLAKDPENQEALEQLAYFPEESDDVS